MAKPVTRIQPKSALAGYYDNPNNPVAYANSNGVNIPLNQSEFNNYGNQGGNLSQLSYPTVYGKNTVAQPAFQAMGEEGSGWGAEAPVAEAPQSKGFMQGISDWWNGTSAPTAAPATTSTGGMSDWFKGTKDQKSIAENVAGGVSALAGLYGAYKTGEYQDKMSKLQQHASDVYDKELAAKNQRLAQAQANYEASFK